MKKLLATLMIGMILFVGCAHNKVIDGKVYEPKGLFNMDKRDSCIQYKVCTGNVIWSIIGSETIVVPILLLGLGLWEPKYVK